MHISFSPQRRDGSLVLEKLSDNRLRINGDLFNFNPMQDGDSIPAGAVPCDWIVGPVERVDGEIHVTLILPHGQSPSPGVAFPATMHVVVNGPIVVPHDEDINDVDS